MEIKALNFDISVCKVPDLSQIDFSSDFVFIGKTDEEISLVCKTYDIPKNANPVDNGWNAFKISGVLDFSLIGILAKISNLLAQNNISIFALSTYNTDYILTKSENFKNSLEILKSNGYNTTY